jgi:hypothetical protein
MLTHPYFPFSSEVMFTNFLILVFIAYSPISLCFFFFDSWMYCLPPGTMSGIAYAFINSWMSVYSNEWCNYPSGQMHELGHNFGYAHSNEGTTNYGDQSGMMGYSYSQDEGPVSKSFQH